MFNKENFSNILREINSKYNSMTEFAKKADFDRAYISKYINMKLNSPPTPKILEKIADASNGITSYYELMEICGYIDLEVIFKLKDNKDTNLCWANKGDLEDWGFATEDINNMIYLSNSDIPDKNKQIANILRKYPSNILNKFYDKAILQTKSLSSIMKPELNNDLITIDIHTLTEVTQKIVSKALKQESNVFPISDAPIKVAVVGKISAGLPILAQENLEGYEYAPSSYIKDGFEYFYLRVQGHSMNLKFDEGDIVLVQKQDTLENDEIGVILVDGMDATVKKYKFENGLAILSPMSTDPSYTVQIYNPKDIDIKIIGKVVSYQGKI